MNFKYKARSQDGKIVEGVLSASTQEGAVAVVRQRGLFPIKIEQSAGSAPAEGSLLDMLGIEFVPPLPEPPIGFVRSVVPFVNKD